MKFPSNLSYDEISFVKRAPDLQLYSDFTPSVHECETCKKMFHRRRHLLEHQQTHDPVNEKKFVCSHEGCHHAYTLERNLKAHVRSVHQGKKFECTHEGCDRKFAFKVRCHWHSCHFEMIAERACSYRNKICVNSFNNAIPSRFSIGSGNGLLPDGIKPLSEPVSNLGDHGNR